MGRDQDTGEPEEEADGGEQEVPVETSYQAKAFDVVPTPPRVAPAEPLVPKVEKPAGQKPGIYSSVKATPKQEPPKPPDDVQINWPPKPVEPAKPPGNLGQEAQPEVEAAPPTAAPEEPAPVEEAAPAEEAAVEEPAETPVPPSRSSFAEAARLRMEARKRASGGGAGAGEPPAEGGGSGEPGQGG